MRKTLISALVATGLATAAPQASADVFGDREDVVRGVAGLAILGLLLDRLGDDDDNRGPTHNYLHHRHHGHGVVVNERPQPHFRVIPVPRTEVHRHDRDRHVHKHTTKSPERKVIVKKPVKKKVVVKRPVTKKVVVKKPVKKKVVVRKPQGVQHKHGHGRHAYWHRHPVRGGGHSHR